jgi:hypothetical protein
MTTTQEINPFVNRPSWAEVIDPLADSPLWVHIRQAASIVLENRLHAMGDFDSGISGSDINHTVFGVASWCDRSSATYPGDVLTCLVHEGYEGRS